MNRVTIYTDGACSGNPGPGGWAAIIINADHRQEISGSDSHTTNNRMEMQGALRALEALTTPSRVELFTDSRYLQRGMSEWIHTWKKNGWKRRSGKRLLPVKNEDLWRRLNALAEIHQITFHWVEGHNRNFENERCDELAQQAINAFK
ncbi:ribonuclease HI [Candidatus Acetothermia bacterium]|nr:ribonuclease HI [Candidatus Acetothermia bacterium]